jgi:hypothetical protein
VEALKVSLPVGFCRLIKLKVKNTIYLLKQAQDLASMVNEKLEKA